MKLVLMLSYYRLKFLKWFLNGIIGFKFTMQRDFILQQLKGLTHSGQDQKSYVRIYERFKDINVS